MCIILHCTALPSINRCINRLVGKGLQFQLQVVLRSHNQEDEILSRATKASRLDRTAERTRDSQPAEMQRREEWGLVALEDVPAGAFICEWAGQYVLGGMI